MPDWKAVVDVARYWADVCSQAFWDALLLFFDTKSGALKALVLFVLGTAVTTLIVWLARSREAFTEHLKSNVAIVIAGGLFTWILVFILFVIAEPPTDHQNLTAQLGSAQEETRVARMGKEAAELQAQQIEKQASSAKIIVKADSCPASPDAKILPKSIQACTPNSSPQVPGMLEDRLPSPMFVSEKYLAGRNMLLAINAFLSLPELRSLTPKCSLRITAPKENGTVAQTLNQLASISGCRVDVSVGDDLHPEIEESNLAGTTPNFVTVHAPKEPKYENFVGALNMFFHLKRKYDVINEGKPSQMIWIQIGSGSPWQEKNTYGYTIGSGF
jgi:hypothetical protein